MKRMPPTRWSRFLSAKDGVCGGRLCAKGTRIPVVVILDSLAEGASEAGLLASYPTLTRSHIRAAIRYAAALAREDFRPLPKRHAHQARRESTRRAG
jgi:uncharacterized protein (DUF433 family)